MTCCGPIAGNSFDDGRFRHNGLAVLAFGATLGAPHGGIFVIGLVGNWPLYLLAIAIGPVVSAALVIGVKEFTGGSDKEKATSAA